ncbi:hypothetical protein [Micrococcus luteus]|uniref:hypothetical protein n=1 Tax=Micrococcus luteus TaxID=1270 RepID=UPI001AE6312E|nr:hypothetical protein [Micrococcus luteus]QTP19224.1 hypothetical protein J7660_04145 [Micrococcus luteus]
MPAGKSIRRVARAGARLLPPEQRHRVRRTGGALLRRLPPQVAEEVRGVFGIRWGAPPARDRPADALGLAGGPARTRTGSASLTGRGAAAVGADPEAAARLERAMGLADTSRTERGGRAVGVVAAPDVRAALAAAGHRVVPLVPGTAGAVAARVEAVVVDVDGVDGPWAGALDAAGAALYLELRGAVSAAAARGVTVWVLSRGRHQHRLGALALLHAGDVIVVEAGAGRTPLHFTEDPGDAPQGIADVLAACPEESA